MDYIYYIILAVLVVIVLIVLFVVLNKNKKKNFYLERKKQNNELLLCLGGRENIVSAVNNGSRLSLVLKDYSLVQEDKLKQLGVSSFIKMSNKLTVVIGEEAKDISLLINSDKTH